MLIVFIIILAICRWFYKVTSNALLKTTSPGGAVGPKTMTKKDATAELVEMNISEPDCSQPTNDPTQAIDIFGPDYMTRTNDGCEWMPRFIHGDKSKARWVMVDKSQHYRGKPVLTACIKYSEHISSPGKPENHKWKECGNMECKGQRYCSPNCTGCPGIHLKATKSVEYTAREYPACTNHSNGLPYVAQAATMHRPHTNEFKDAPLSMKVEDVDLLIEDLWGLRTKSLGATQEKLLRKSPITKSKQFPLGTIRIGLDGKNWIVTQRKRKGTHYNVWTLHASTV